MFGSTMLDVAIGLAFLYFVLSLMTTTVTEFVARFLALRSNNLQRGIESLLHDLNNNQLAKEFYEHPLIASLSRPSWFDRLVSRGGGKPSYIPSEAFAKVIVDLVRTKAGSNEFRAFEYVDLLREMLRDPRVAIDPNVKRQLLIVLERAETVEEAYVAIQKWFDDMMDRASGWYKRKAQIITLIVAALVTLAVNADTTLIFNRLLNDPELRDAVSVAAEGIVQDYTATNGQDVVTPPDSAEDTGSTATPGAAETPDAADTLALDATLDQLKELQQQLDVFDLIGWSDDPNDPRAWPAQDDTNAIFSKVIGLLVTAVLVSLGAPFWFDTLQRLTRIRATGDVNSGLYVPPTEPREPSPIIVSVPAATGPETNHEASPAHDKPAGTTGEASAPDDDSATPRDETSDVADDNDEETHRRG